MKTRHLLATLVLTAAAIVPTNTAEADHRPCAEIIDVRPQPDHFTGNCTGVAENGWFQARGFCMSVTWVIEDGVVVDTILEFEGPFKSTWKYKSAFEWQETATMVCPDAYPYLAHQHLPVYLCYKHGTDGVVYCAI